jgi:CheY-like chemotaxis protein
MKSTALNTLCFSDTRRAARGGKFSTIISAHTPVRHRTAPGSPDVPASLQSLDHPAYFDTLESSAPTVKPSGNANAAHPRVLHVDTETGTAIVLASLLGSGVNVTHVATLAEARQLLQTQIFSLVILDPSLPDGDAKILLPLLSSTPLLVYSDLQPEWRQSLPVPYLSKSWTTARQLWTRMSAMLYNTSALSAGD